MQTLTTQLTAHQRVQQIIQALLTLPPEKISEVWDFVAFLQGRYAGTPSVDVSDTRIWNGGHSMWITGSSTSATRSVNAWPRYRRTRPAVIGGILLWWLSTVPIAAILAAIIFHILRAVFG